ncbi:MAG: hypothetical protein GY769_10650, partial [bacterium]|nr:hypothetical protein [bacterium]
MENRRLLFAALLSVVILIGWNYLLVTLRPPEDPSNLSTLDEGVPHQETGSPRDSGPEESAPQPLLPEQGETVSPGTDDPGTQDPSEAIDFGADMVAASEESRAVLETDEFRAEFTNLGAQLVSLQLLKHAGPNGAPLEMVVPRGTDPYPFAMVVGGERSHPLNKVLFEWTEETDAEGFALLRFRHSSERGAAE